MVLEGIWDFWVLLHESGRSGGRRFGVSKGAKGAKGAKKIKESDAAFFF